jgi:hypothetical protein
MKSPFPGMDPFIEARRLWSDFHARFIVELHRTLNATLPPRYEALVEERTYLDVVESIEESRLTKTIRPDVRIDKHSNGQVEPWPAGGGQALLTVPVVMHPNLDVDERESFIEVYDSAQGDRVVTCIEALSPSNKRPSSSGWGEFERKRQYMFRGAANFVEIDLLRGGRRRAMREVWPNSPYYVLVMRKEQAPRCAVFPAFSTQRLPTVPIPLADSDPDILCDLQAVVDAVLASSRYDRRLRYEEPIEPPLSRDEQLFLSSATSK